MGLSNSTRPSPNSARPPPQARRAPGADSLLRRNLAELGAQADQSNADAVAWRDTLRAKRLWKGG